jgi:hypothetical protein
MATSTQLAQKVAELRANPIAIKRMLLGTLENLTDNEVIIIDPTNPFVFLMEASVSMASATMLDGEALTRQQYPSPGQSCGRLRRSPTTSHLWFCESLSSLLWPNFAPQGDGAGPADSLQLASHAPRSQRHDAHRHKVIPPTASFVGWHDRTNHQPEASSSAARVYCELVPICRDNERSVVFSQSLARPCKRISRVIAGEIRRDRDLDLASTDLELF